jgi:DNA-nicking Smr family endonuclease
VVKREEKPKPVADDRGDGPTDEDAFARAMADVAPLGPDPREKVRVVPPGHTSRSLSSASDSDADAFARAMADVIPLAPDPRGRVRTVPTVAAPQSPAPVAEVDEDPASQFVRPGIDRRELRKLKRGAYPVDDRLDLHGMTAAEACTDVARFVENSRHKRRRCVCIVHGRGLHSKDQVSVLKTRVRASLESNPLVLACTDAPPSDGGAGAVYVLLRR